MKNPYIQHEGKVVGADSRFKHVMAIALDPRTGYKEGVIRCIKSREGDVSAPGYIDRSELYTVSGNSLENFVIKEKLNIKDTAGVVADIHSKGLDFLGFEDPDIWIDESTDTMHLYFTLPLAYKSDSSKYKIHLGHAVGKNIHSLEMTKPILLADRIGGAKELSVAPVNSKGLRLNLVESAKKEREFTYSVIRIARAHNMGNPWEFGDIIFHPKEHKISWIGGHASPGPLFPKTFIDLGENKLVGIINGREANYKIKGEKRYGIFSVGLFIYDYELGKIDWVSPEPLIRDSEAQTITFASQFVETGQGEGILYAHVDDSFVRAYTLNAEVLKDLLPPPGKYSAR